jgi:glycosyltransferase involved in cell wall biosynthesis
MPSAPLVSVLMPLCHAEPAVHEGIASVCAQVFQNWELLLLFDAADDQSREQVQRWTLRDERVRTLPCVGGIEDSVARNAGLVAAQGTYLCFMDASEVWSRHKLRDQVLAMVEGPWNLSFCDHLRLSSDRPGWLLRVRGPDTLGPAQLLRDGATGLVSAMIRRDRLGDLCFQAGPQGAEAYWLAALNRVGVAHRVASEGALLLIHANALREQPSSGILARWRTMRSSYGLGLLQSARHLLAWLYARNQRAVFGRWPWLTRSSKWIEIKPGPTHDLD